MKLFVKTLQVLVAFCTLLTAPLASSIEAQEGTVEIRYKGRSYIGRAIAWDGSDALLMRRDGRMSVVPADEESDFKSVSRTFKPLEPSVIRQKLQKEFGGKYQVSVTSNFVVVHPKGPHTKWAQPFEVLYTRFRSYFSTRGLALEEPEFPMVAIILRTRGEFDKFLKLYHRYDPQILGYYSPRSNRVVTYDQSDIGADWLLTADTIVHEAAHQTAFNTGMHSRTGDCPTWISEGLATMFEAPGVNNCLHYSTQSDRINKDQLRNLKAYYKDEKVSSNVVELISRDRLFRSDALLAYSMSWGLTFYLSETQPRKFHNFLRSNTERDDFAGYDSAERVEEFARHFGEDFDDLAARMKQFYKKLPTPVR